MKQPRADEHAKLEQMRQYLRNQLGVIDSLWQRIEGAGGCLEPMQDVNDPETFDDLDDDFHEQCSSMPRNNDGQGAAIEVSDVSLSPEAQDFTRKEDLPEHRILPVPSAMVQPLDHHREIEMRLRMRQADTLLTSLRELIADKSFNYSHILRPASRQSMRSRARSKIANINAEISLCCRAYTHCRTAMIRLQVTEDMMRKYQALTKNDIKASTALLDPNKPGSSTLRLSWIWQTQSPGQSSTKEAVIECTYCVIISYMYNIHPVMTVQRVHWLRARAQSGRWNEEVLLVTYEMQWTIRYFLHQTQEWKHLRATKLDSGNLAAGPAAYASRKAAMWQWLALTAKGRFSQVNPNMLLDDM
jgi:hypothetical protein